MSRDKMDIVPFYGSENVKEDIRLRNQVHDVTTFTRIVSETVSLSIGPRQVSVPSVDQRTSRHLADVPLGVHSLLVNQWKAGDLSRALINADTVPNAAGLSAH